jgi:hypothetical protein
MNKENIISDKEFEYRTNLPLSEKIDMTLCKIEQWHNKWDGQIHVSF